jgi:hypothetical protein
VESSCRTVVLKQEHEGCNVASADEAYVSLKRVSFERDACPELPLAVDDTTSRLPFYFSSKTDLLLGTENLLCPQTNQSPTAAHNTTPKIGPA